MQIGILGTGSVGQTLAAGFRSKGHTVHIGTRDPSAHDFDCVTFAEAAEAADVVVLAVNGMAGLDVVSACGHGLDGKLVLDTTNPLEFRDGTAHRPASVDGSLLQTYQEAAPRAHFVKAWNCVPGGMMVDPPFEGTQFICGDSHTDDAKKLLADFGWGAVIVGDSSVAPYVEGMALTVINHGTRSGDWNWGLRLMQA